MRNNILKMAALLPALLLTFCTGFAQTTMRAADRVRQAHEQGQMFNPVTENAAAAASGLAQVLQPQVTQYSLFEWTAEDAAAMSRSGTAALALTLPKPGGETVTLELVEVNNFAVGYSAVTESGERIKTTGAHYYQGIVKGDNNSLAAISIFDNEIGGFFSSGGHNYVVGRLRNTQDKAGYNIVYSDRYLTKKPPVNCSTPDIAIPLPANTGVTSLTSRCVRMYFETEVDFYAAFGNNATSVTNYVNNLFNQVRTLYNNDGVSVALSQILVWTTADPYTGSNTSTTLSQFQSTRTSFNGDVAQLLTTRFIGGGLAAVINGLCSSNANRMCVSGDLTTSFPNVPTSSWEVYVTTHEFGHLLGSRHTHACVWNGNNTAIDGCSGFTEGGCALPGYPANGGTIMSYCHIIGQGMAGINFNNGFGPQPAAQIRNTVEAAACLSSCGGGGGCPNPTGLGSFGDCGYADVWWNAVAGASSYTLEYKRTTATVWTSVNTGTSTYYTIFGSSGFYNWRVRANCSGGGSNFVNGANFRIIAPGSPACFLRSQTVKDGRPADESVIKLVPQPATGQVTVYFRSGQQENVQISIHSQFGMPLLRKTVRAAAGENQAGLDIGALKNGVYTLQVQNSNGVQSAKLLVGE